MEEKRRVILILAMFVLIFLGLYLLGSQIIIESQIIIAILTFVVVLVAVFTYFEQKKLGIQMQQREEKVMEQLQTEVKHLTGTLYLKAQIEDIKFWIPRKGLYEPNPNCYKIGNKIKTQNQITIPANKTCEIVIKIIFKEKQSVRKINAGFGKGYNVKPRVIGRTHPFISKEINLMEREEFIGLWGNYQVEYISPRRVPAGENFLAGFIIETGEPEEYKFNVKVTTDEAINEYKKALKIIVK